MYKKNVPVGRKRTEKMGLAACYPSPISYHAQRRVPFLHRIGGNFSSPSLLLGDNFEMDSNGSESRVTSSKSRAERKKRAAARKKYLLFSFSDEMTRFSGYPRKKNPSLMWGNHDLLGYYKMENGALGDLLMKPLRGPSPKQITRIHISAR